MGTNYFLKLGVCPHCKKPDKVLHIGKSSAGWCFSLHVIPEEGIHDLDDWKRVWADGVIEDEYGDRVEVPDMLRCITQRYWKRHDVWDEERLAENHAVPGPNGLVRHRIEPNFCIGHGPGTYDLCPGEFS